MRASRTIRGALLAAVGALAVALPVGAQEDEAAAKQEAEWGGEGAAAQDDPPEPSPEPEGDTAKPDEGDAAASAAATESAPPVDEGASESAPSEGRDGQYLGARYRGLFLPQAVLNWFIDGGESVYVHGVGPEFAIRNGRTEYLFSAWLALYNMGPVPIKGASDEDEAWEFVESEIKSIYLTADYLGHTPLATGLELSYGGGAGLGILFGDLRRTQAALVRNGTRGDPDDYVPCLAIGDPDLIYCDDYNEHYGDYTEPSWFGGGAKPVLFPWLAGQLGLRYQPHPKFVGRLDLGLSVSGLFFGVGADYGL